MKTEGENYRNLRSYLYVSWGFFIRKNDFIDFVHDVIIELLSEGLYDSWEDNKHMVNKIASKIRKRYNRLYKREEEISWDIEYDEREKIENEIFISQLLSKLDGKKRKIIELFLLGYSKKEIAKELSISNSYISKVFNELSEIAGEIF